MTSINYKRNTNYCFKRSSRHKVRVYWPMSSFRGSWMTGTCGVWGSGAEDELDSLLVELEIRLSAFNRRSQWSDIEELEEPVGQK